MKGKIFIYLSIFFFNEVGINSIPTSKEYTFTGVIKNAKISSFQNKDHPYGIDLYTLKDNYKIYSPEKCTVKEISKTENGTPFIICEGEKYVYKYMHFYNYRNISSGKLLLKNEVIGEFCDCGVSQGIHLHIELYSLKGELIQWREKEYNYILNK